MSETATPADFASVLEQVRAIVRPHLRQLDPDASLADDTQLEDLGLTSLGAVDLFLELERRFDVMLPDDALTTDTVSDVQTLARAIWSLVR